MIFPETAPDATLDPWCVVPTVTGERLLFGYAVSHPKTGGLSWMCSSPVQQLDETGKRAVTASGRHYALGRPIEPADIVAEGEEAWLAFDLLIGSAARDAAAVPSISTDRRQDGKWLTACKVARHLGSAAPARTPLAVQAFLRRHGQTYLKLRSGEAVPTVEPQFTPAADECEWPDRDEIIAAARQPDLADPARVAAHCLLNRALEAAGLTPDAAGRDGSVCLIVVPDVSWTGLVRDEWRRLVRAGQRPEDGDRHRYASDPVTWFAWTADEPPRPHDLKAAAESFSKSLARGAHCAGFAADATWLPSDLALSADYRLTIPAPTAADAGLIARLLCGHEPGEILSDEQAAGLTPRLLRLARRLDQSADAYIRKLRDLLMPDRQAASGNAPGGAQAGASAGSPRDAPTLDRLHGMDEAVDWGLGLAADLSDYKAGRLSWKQVGGHAALLSGPPGCGKTLFARALAATCAMPLISGSYAIWHSAGSAHQGDFLKAMRKSFAEARAAAPCILFVDEIDSFPDRGKLTHSWADYEIQIVNALLAEIDGVEGRDGVILLAAANHPEKLDPALVRSGRLDRHFRVRLPDRAGLVRILREHLAEDLAGEDVSAAALAATGSSGADCERLVRGARRRARAARRAMEMADLLAEIGGADDRSPEDRWIAAVHEAGHAVAICALRPGGLGVVSLHASGDTGGMTAAAFATSAFVRPGDLKQRLVMLLAGRAAEETVFGQASSGAGGGEASDLARATACAAIAVTALGLDETEGLVWRGRPEIHAVPEQLAAHPALAGRVRVMLDDAYAIARDLIGARLPAVTALARALAARRVLDGPEAEAIMRRSLPEAATGRDRQP